MNRSRIPIVVVVAVIAAAAAFAVWYQLGRGAQEARALGGSGTVEADEVLVSPLAGGRILKAPVREGDRVKKGATLFEIDAVSARLQVQQAEAGVRAAEANLRAKRDDDAPKGEIDAARAGVDQARTAVALAKLQLGYATVTAPIDGVVLTLAGDAGENAVPGQTLAVLGDLSRLTVDVFVPETDIGRVKAGAKGTATTDSLPGESFDCTVRTVATEAEFTPAAVETKDQRAKLVYRVTLDISGADGDLKPGMPVDVEL